MQIFTTRSRKERTRQSWNSLPRCQKEPSACCGSQVACAREDEGRERSAARGRRMSDVRNVFSTVVDSDDDRPLFPPGPEVFVCQTTARLGHPCHLPARLCGFHSWTHNSPSTTDKMASSRTQMPVGDPGVRGADQGHQDLSEGTRSLFVGEAHPTTVEAGRTSHPRQSFSFVRFRKPFCWLAQEGIWGPQA